jgi:hypothetical protein
MEYLAVEIKEFSEVGTTGMGRAATSGAQSARHKRAESPRIITVSRFTDARLTAAGDADSVLGAQGRACPPLEESAKP